MKRKRILKIVIFTFLLVLIGTVCGFLIYTNNYYRVNENDVYRYSSDKVMVETDDSNNIWFRPKNSSNLKNEAFCFYPGGLVESDAYCPIMYKLALDGYVGCIANMPFKLAFFNANGADAIVNDESNLTTDTKYSDLNWYIGGHSLGGVFAARYYQKHSDTINGLVLMASYSDKDLSDTSGRVLSIYGSCDGVLKFDNYNKYKTNLTNLTEYVMDGGNHSYFGDYGLQKGDNIGTITPLEQWNIVTRKIEEFMSI